MIIYSWNMLFRNRELDRAFEFIAHADFDIFCLQEVPQDFLERLLALPCHHAYTVDVERIFSETATPNYLVILSRHHITREARFAFPEYWSLLPLRARAFVRLMRPFHFSKIRNRSGFFADIGFPGGSVRVFNLHLILAHPMWRLKEFEMAMAEKDSGKPTIVCGDFNILEKPHITLLNWLLGGRMTDALLYRRERTLIEERFVAHELVNALRGESTHKLSRSQLDHILVSRSFSIKSVAVLPDRIGSDHHPIRVEIE
jgi:endonuclease/exonuclease/phosphatase family metal-dependent hydrolase